MTKRMQYTWHLRRLMAERGMYQTSDLVPLLADWGIVLSREQVFRLVTQPPQRMSMDTLAALCGILKCEVQDLIEVHRGRHCCVHAEGGQLRCGSTGPSDNRPPADRSLAS